LKWARSSSEQLFVEPQQTGYAAAFEGTGKVLTFLDTGSSLPQFRSLRIVNVRIDLLAEMAQ
jgi:hypothetical protein